MPSCEKCWHDAGTIAQSAQTDKVVEYRKLIAERECTPEEQAGPDARECFFCRRVAVHQLAHVCMACGKLPPGIEMPGRLPLS